MNISLSVGLVKVLYTLLNSSITRPPPKKTLFSWEIHFLTTRLQHEKVLHIPFVFLQNIGGMHCLLVATNQATGF